MSISLRCCSILLRILPKKCTLADEIAWVSNYLDIMSRRYDNVFVTRMDIEEELVDCRVPKFLLQPLVEIPFSMDFPKDRKEAF